MKFALRFSIAWPLGLLCGAIYLLGSSDGLLLMLFYYVPFMTPFAVAFCAFASALEKTRIGAFAGALVAIAVPALLYLVAPNKQNATAATEPLLPIVVLTGVFWSSTWVMFKRSRYA